MKLTSKLIMLGAVVALSACANTRADRFGSGNVTPDTYNSGTGTGTGTGANSGIIPGSANDPTSTAYFQQTVGDRVLFEVDQSVLTAQGRATLDGQAQWLISNVEYNALIEGHADEQGTRQYNLALGARRASAVQQYLISKGLPANRIKTVSYGKERPIEICSEESCYTKNRRAVTIVTANLTS